MLSWDGMTDGIAQGTHYVVLGWYASLIGLYVIVMAAWVPLLGMAASLGVAALLRMRPPAAMPELAQRWLLLFGPAVFLAATWGTWTFMWWSHPPVATEFARYDAAYFWISGLIIGSLAISGGGYAAGIVLRGTTN